MPSLSRALGVALLAGGGVAATPAAGEDELLRGCNAVEAAHEIEAYLAAGH